VRKVCDHCRVSYLADKSDRELLAAEPLLATALKRQAGKKELSKITLYKGQGCSNCGNTGFAGRTGVFEVMEIEDTLRSLINQKAPASVIYKAAIKQGMKTMLEDGVDKALAGQTTLAEVMRSTKF
jgi:type II secretory ATPase GspE/PulE/Tfp pilus assembly ATPase PilB-like protein